MKVIFVGTLLMAAAPVFAGPGMVAVTPSGRTEMMFPSMTAQDASGKIGARCIANGLTLVNSTPNDVTCEVRMSAMKSALAQALVGNSYSTTPKNLIKFNLAQSGPVVLVQANEWIETQMAFGQTRTEPIASDTVHNDLINFLAQAGATYVPGTSFPNHAYLGSKSTRGMKMTYKGKQVNAVVMNDYQTDSPLVKAGAQPGDAIVAIQGKGFATVKDVEKRLDGIPVGSTYDVDVIRADQVVTLKPISVRKPTVTGEALATASLPGAVPPSVAQISVADELAKLSDLKAKGILTQSEFDAQKAKLLAR